MFDETELLARLDAVQCVRGMIVGHLSVVSVLQEIPDLSEEKGPSSTRAKNHAAMAFELQSALETLFTPRILSTVPPVSISVIPSGDFEMDIPVALLAQVVDINEIRRRISTNRKIATRERDQAELANDPESTIHCIDTALAHEGIADALQSALETLFPVSELAKLPAIESSV